MRSSCLAVLMCLLATAALADANSDFQLGQQAIQDSRFGDAVSISSKAIQSGEVKLESIHLFYFQRGYAEFQLENLQAAVADFSLAILRRPDFDAPYYYRGLAYYRLQQDDTAIGDLTTAIKLNPKNGQAYLFRASVFEDHSRWSEAASDLQKAIEVATSAQERSVYQHELEKLTSMSKTENH